MGRDVHGASCPWGQLSMGPVVHGASCPWAEFSMGRDVVGRVLMGRVVRGASFDGCPWLLVGSSSSRFFWCCLRKTIFCRSF
jgi:hypothetical protein